MGLELFGFDMKANIYASNGCLCGASFKLGVIIYV
jgi:hypothetical protein